MTEVLADVDVAVIGAGIAGASVAGELARRGTVRVALIEQEDQPGYHTTGRSAAIFAPIYGSAPIRALTRASEAFFRTPPDGFCDNPLFSPRSSLMIGRGSQVAALEALYADVSGEGDISLVDGAEVRRINPLVRDGYAVGGVLDETGQDVDVAALHHGFLRMHRAHGGQLFTRAEVVGVTQAGAGWEIDTTKGRILSGIVVNAAGAWAGKVGEMAGAEDIRLQPKRRTALTIEAPASVHLPDLPITIDIDEEFYLKPEVGSLMLSPADETDCDPCDAQPEELDIAICIDRIETAFDLAVRRIESKWAGLRSFVPDKSLVIGAPTAADGFFWLAGQGGYGIQTAPAASQLAAALILGENLPSVFMDVGLNLDSVLPARFV